MTINIINRSHHPLPQYETALSAGMDLRAYLPDNPITDAFLQQMRGFGVNVSYIAKGGDRMGVYFVEKGASMRPSKVIYDRKYSSIAAAKPLAGIHRERLDAEILSVTGICGGSLHAVFDDYDLGFI